MNGLKILPYIDWIAFNRLVYCTAYNRDKSYLRNSILYGRHNRCDIRSRAYHILYRETFGKERIRVTNKKAEHFYQIDCSAYNSKSRY